jgi:hypothetical protein
MSIVGVSIAALSGAEGTADILNSPIRNLKWIGRISNIEQTEIAIPIFITISTGRIRVGIAARRHRGIGKRAAQVGAMAAVPIAAGLAITRFHLYDVDRVISRTTAYALVSGVLLGVYVTIVTALTSLAPASGATGEPDSWVVAIATLAAAAMFRPLLRWAQSLVDRRFNREQYDAELTVERFALRLRDEVGTQEVREDLLQVLGRTMQPRVSGLWLSDRDVS